MAPLRFKGHKVEVAMSWREVAAALPAMTPAWKLRACSSRSKRDRSAFHALASWDACVEAAHRGWDEGRALVGPALDAALAQQRMERVPATRLDCGGERPFIPAACAGDPRSMIRRRPAALLHKPMLDVVVNCTASYGVPSQHLANRGAAVMASLTAAEVAGWPTRITVAFSTGYGSKSVTVRVVVKEPGERWDEDRLAFALVCPDFMRRIMFAFVEACEDLPDFAGGYGCVKDLKPAPGEVYFGSTMSSSDWATPEKARANVVALLAKAHPGVAA